MSHNIILNEGDGVTEGAIRTILGRSSMSGYVEQNTLGITYHEDNTADVEAGEVHILHNRQDITVETDAFVGHDLVDNSENTLWIVVDPSAATDDEAVSLVSNATGVEPTNPAIEIAVVDTNKSPQDDSAVQPSNRGTAAALDGEDINPRSIGGGQRTLQVFAELVDAVTVDAVTVDAGTVDGESFVGGGAEFDAVDAQAGSFGSVNAGRVNSTHWVDAGGDDFGAALNAVLDDAAEGDVIMVPEHEWRGPHTPVTVNTNYLTIRSERLTGRDNWRYAPPRIVDVDGMDAPFITALSVVAIGGLTFAKSDGIADGQGAIQNHQPCYIDGVIGQNMNAPTVHLRNDGTLSPDNVNNSIVKNVSGNGCSSDVVKASVTNGAIENTNGLNIHVTTAKDCDGYGVNMDGFGNYAQVDHAAGGVGGIRFGSRRSSGKILYAGDGLDHASNFAHNNNGVEYVHVAGGTDLQIGMDANTNNQIRWAWPQNGADLKQFSYPYEFDTDVKFTAPHGARFVSADGTVWKLRIDNSGSLLIQEV